MASSASPTTPTIGPSAIMKPLPPNWGKRATLTNKTLPCVKETPDPDGIFFWVKVALRSLKRTFNI